MPKMDIINKSKKVVANIDLSELVFAAEIKEPLVHQTIVAQLASRRGGNHSTKTRSEVRGGGKKPWAQKGSGRARAGTRRSPLWRGGGIIFGPKPRDYSMAVNKKMKKAALSSVLSSLVSEKRFVIVDSLELKEIKTKKAMEFLTKIDSRSPKLVIHGAGCENFVRSAANITGVTTLNVAGLNAYDMLCAEVVVCTKDAVNAIEERFSK
jgi:large subunit ribosomal protein L4